MEVAKEEIANAAEDITAPKMHTVRNPYAFAKAETNGPEMHTMSFNIFVLTPQNQSFPGNQIINET